MYFTFYTFTNKTISCVILAYKIEIQIYLQLQMELGLFMHFCDSNYEITRMQQEEKQ